MKKIFREAQVMGLLKSYYNGIISFSRFVEILNEEVNKSMEEQENDKERAAAIRACKINNQ